MIKTESIKKKKKTTICVTHLLSQKITSVRWEGTSWSPNPTFWLKQKQHWIQTRSFIAFPIQVLKTLKGWTFLCDLFQYFVAPGVEFFLSCSQSEAPLSSHITCYPFLLVWISQWTHNHCSQSYHHADRSGSQDVLVTPIA